jgi:hypothetical protein
MGSGGCWGQHFDRLDGFDGWGGFLQDGFIPERFFIGGDMLFGQLAYPMVETIF